MRRTVSIVSVAALLIVGLAFLGGRGRAAPLPIQPVQYVYSVKFLCGLQQISSAAFTQPAEPIVKPGNYATVVNVQNVRATNVAIVKQAVIAIPETQSTQGKTGLSAARHLVLSPGEALEVDCADIASLLAPSGTTTPLPAFIDGFVDIRSPDPLSVTAAYTSQTCLNPASQGSTGTTTKGCSELGALALDVVPQSPLEVPVRVGP